mgnify:CR=1 FL=1
MQSAVAKALGYDESPNFVVATELEGRPFLGHSHVYRKAHEECGLQGVYLLKAPDRQDEVPVVFYCQADNEAAAREIHRRVWNQGIVPFILVETPKALRLYSGFRCLPEANTDQERGVLEAAVAFNEVADRLGAFRSDAIDSGAVWDRWANEVDPRSRVDWSLLAGLEALGKELRDRCHQLDRPHAHALIGKFVYLKYLRDRRILSDRKLAKWGLTESDLFGHAATMTAFWRVNDELEDWLNGSVFPLPRNAIRAEHVRLVANVFMGGSGRQLSLNLGLYDFSFIPIETLSVIYQQFLHAPEEGRASRGREAGAYYTPLPLVNYMLGELESRRPLVEGMRVLDPSCGSGAFLVQCYRMLIEKRLLKQDHLRPAELRKILRKHIFGVDRDGDACQVAEMSLILTLLDYTQPPDLESNPQFKLPTLWDENIFHADFFQEGTRWAWKRLDFKADWLVGNPPWMKASKKRTEDRHALKWMEQNAEEFPTGGNQLAEAFVWHSLPLLNEGAVAGLLLPAMTLFKMDSTGFRARLFQTVQAWCVANFANLAYVLFAGRSQVPAMAMFFSPRKSPRVTIHQEERILTFAPFLANQRAGRAERAAHRKDTWSIVVNGAEMRELPTSSVASGSFLPWKEAMWGSFRDGKLLGRIAKRFPSLHDFAGTNELRVHQGFEIRARESGEKTEPMPELSGRMQVEFSRLKECGRIFTFPKKAFSTIPAAKAYVRQGRGKLPLSVSSPPHIIVAASRQFAVYSDAFLAIPARQIGIAGPDGTQCLLKAISLLIGSRFCTYHQFFSTSQWGIGFLRANLDVLRALPIPLAELTDKQLCGLATMRDDLAAKYAGCAPPDAILRKVDERIYDLYGLTHVERILIDDFIHWNMEMVHGKVTPKIVAPPADGSILTYLGMLKDELDAFVGDHAGASHDICAVRGNDSAMIVVRIVNGEAPRPTLLDGSERIAAALARTREHLLMQHNSQWLYFERCLKVYQDGVMYVLKPLEAIHWTRRQAILDAGEIVAETLGTQDE